MIVPIAGFLLSVIMLLIDVSFERWWWASTWALMMGFWYYRLLVSVKG